MYQVKHSRKGELLEFDPEVYRTSLQERRCHEEFRRLINEELVTYRFQPIIDAKDGSVFAYEALMRVDLPMLRSPTDVLRLAREENCLHEVERITFFCASSAYHALENAAVILSRRERSLPPARRSSAWPIRFMPKRNRHSPPIIVSTLKISIFSIFPFFFFETLFITK